MPIKEVAAERTPDADRAAVLENFIVVGIDGSEAATAAALWAAAEAQRRGVELCLVHAYASPAVGVGGHSTPPPVDTSVRSSAGTLLRVPLDAVTRAYPGLVVRTVLEPNSPVAVLRAASESAVLTVVGSHGEHQLTEALLGSVATRVAEHGHGPIVVIRADDGTADLRSDGPVLVGLDGSPDSEYALAFAFEEAAVRRVPLIAIRAWDKGALDGFLGLYPLLIDPAAIDAQEGEMLAGQLADWELKFPEVAVHPLVVRGRPAAALVHSCADPDRSGRLPALVVVGSRGRGGLAGMLMGSVSRAVIAHAPCGVAVVRPAA